MYMCHCDCFLACWSHADCIWILIASFMNPFLFIVFSYWCICVSQSVINRINYHIHVEFFWYDWNHCWCIEPIICATVSFKTYCFLPYMTFYFCCGVCRWIVWKYLVYLYLVDLYSSSLYSFSIIIQTGKIEINEIKINQIFPDNPRAYTEAEIKRHIWKETISFKRHWYSTICLQIFCKNFYVAKISGSLHAIRYDGSS